MIAHYSKGVTLLTLDHISLSYEEQPVLRDISATVEDIRCDDQALDGSPIIKGQVVCILGPSGVGKSSLFRIMAGLMSPTSGSVYINNCACGLAGCNKERCEVQAGNIGVVAQSYPLFPHRTVMSNLMLAAMKKDEDRSLAEDKVRTLALEYNLHEKLHQHPRDLSGGQRQRVAILQQILCSNHFILMDEPFSGLDPISLDKTIKLITRVANSDELMTIIIVTHDIHAACTVADHLWLMGREHEGETVVPGARIVKQYNLLDEGLAWQPDIHQLPEFQTFVNKIRDEFSTL